MKANPYIIKLRLSHNSIKWSQMNKISDITEKNMSLFHKRYGSKIVDEHETLRLYFEDFKKEFNY